MQEVSDAVAAYQAALTDLEKTNDRMRTMLRCVGEGNAALQPWQTVILEVNGDKLGKRASLNTTNIEELVSMAKWPSLEDIRDALLEQRDAMVRTQTAYQQVPHDRRIGLVAPDAFDTP